MQSNPFDQFDAQQGNPFDGPMIIQPNAERMRREQEAERRRQSAEDRANTASERAAAAAERSIARDQRNFEYKVVQDQIKREDEKRKASTPPLSAKERADAVAAFHSADAMDRELIKMRELYADGPGATSGIMSLQDYLPLAANKQFDASGNAVRGQVGTLLGFTGGQLNSVAEAQMAVGPYLPQAGDNDRVIQDKMQRLADMAKDARVRSTALLGGIPDANGRVSPVAANASINPNAFGQPNAVNPDNQIRYLAPANTNDGKVAGKSQIGFSIPGTGQGVRTMLASGRSADEIVDWMRGHVHQSGAPVVVSPDQVRWIRKLVGERNQDPVAFSRKKIDWRSLDQVDKSDKQDATLLEEFGMSPYGAGAIAAGNSVSGGLLDEVTTWAGGDGSMVQAVKDQSRADHPIASLGGDIAGGTLGMLGVNRAIGAAGQGGAKLAQWGGGVAGDALYGAAYGAGENNENRGTGALVGGLAGAGGSFVGNKATGMFGRGLRGVSDPAVRYLTDRGVPLSIGQILGNRGLIGKAAAKAESMPGIGNLLAGRRLDSMRGFNRAAYQDALSPIGGNSLGRVGSDAIEGAQSEVSRAYGDALQGVRVQADNQFVEDLTPQIAAGRQIPTKGDEFGWTMDNQIGPMFGHSGELTGETIQGALQNLRGAGREFSKEGAMGQAAAQATRNVENSFMDLIERQSPGTINALRAANTANRNVSILEDAGLAALNGQAGAGIFTPAQLGAAMKANTKKFGGKRSAARGDMPFARLQEYGQQVLPSTVPDSGTAGRLAGILVPAGLAGGSYGLSDVNPYAAGALGTAALLSTKGGAKVVQNGLVRRGDRAVQLGEQVLARRRLGGMFAAPLVISPGVSSQ